jgi:hypothetical protein
MVAAKLHPTLRPWGTSRQGPPARGPFPLSEAVGRAFGSFLARSSKAGRASAPYRSLSSISLFDEKKTRVGGIAERPRRATETATEPASPPSAQRTVFQHPKRDPQQNHVWHFDVTVKADEEFVCVISIGCAPFEEGSRLGAETPGDDGRARAA